MFKVGQKIVCVDDSCTPDLTRNRDYTVSRMATCGCGCGNILVQLREVPIRDVIQICSVTYWRFAADYISFLASRFRALDETFAEETLSRIAEEVEQELEPVTI